MTPRQKTEAQQRAAANPADGAPAQPPPRKIKPAHRYYAPGRPPTPVQECRRQPAAAGFETKRMHAVAGAPSRNVVRSAEPRPRSACDIQRPRAYTQRFQMVYRCWEPKNATPAATHTTKHARRRGMVRRRSHNAGLAADMAPKNLLQVMAGIDMAAAIYIASRNDYMVGCGDGEERAQAKEESASTGIREMKMAVFFTAKKPFRAPSRRHAPRNVACRYLCCRLQYVNGAQAGLSAQQMQESTMPRRTARIV
ncbi:hypothetical protein AVEN_74251-1 [Araneus ventricosus]|uniref:Uncharacterized protein n=1 Tax=Araneus ventricosus TaxID=182803 RepID=A0A4Y2EVK6_ARAVE|nr:hypothetical protein AVEN_74251-1 [Araneus ventricosus]